MSRYSRQELFAGIGAEGQRRLLSSRVVIVGCGALGSSLAEMMARAGVGDLTIIDRDFVEESNLQRQALFEQSDADEALPKAVAAERHLRRLNPDVTVTGVVTDVDARNAAALIEGAQVVLDGTDNFETRFLINDVCLAAGIPWIYGACVGAYGLALAIRPRISPCLRCVLEDLPAPAWRALLPELAAVTEEQWRAELSVEAVLEHRNQIGGTAPERVRAEVREWKRRLE